MPLNPALAHQGLTPLACLMLDTGASKKLIHFRSAVLGVSDTAAWIASAAFPFLAALTVQFSDRIGD